MAKKKAPNHPAPETQVEGPALPEPQLFKMVRHHDETGVSGTGVVAEGMVFSNGKCAVCWLGALSCVQVWETFDAFKKVHIDAHPANGTVLVWDKER
jgi:hypothetical protein